ncbi:hypothetical protein SGPA1_11117 [Streptomyces misionensis JCM 4497]
MGRVPRPGARRHHAGADRRLPHQGRAPRVGGLRAGLPAAARLLLRLRRPDRRRGHLQRCPGLPQAEVQERGDHPRGDGPAGRHHVLRHHRPGRGDQGPHGREPGHRPAAQRPPDRLRLRPEPGDLPGRRGGLRQGQLPVRAPGGRDRAGAVPRGEHRVQRLPAARLDPRPGPLPAPPAAHPRRPARLLQRHRAAGRRRRPADRDLRRRLHAPDPAVHRRRVRVLHAQPDRHGPALEPPPRGREGPGQAAPHDALAGDQHLRRLPHRPGAGRRPGHQVHARRLGGPAGHVHLLRDHDRDPQALRPGRRGDRRPRGARRRPGPPVPGALGGADLQDPPADPAGPGLRAADALRHPGGAHRQRRPGRDQGAARGVGAARHRRTAEGPGLAVPRDHPPGDRVRQGPAQAVPARRGLRDHPRVRGRPLVRAPAAQPERPAAQGPSAVHARRDGHLRPLPAGLFRGGPGQGPQAPGVERPGRRAPRPGGGAAEGAVEQGLTKGRGSGPGRRGRRLVGCCRFTGPCSSARTRLPAFRFPLSTSRSGVTHHAGRTDHVSGGRGVRGRDRPRRPRRPLHRPHRAGPGPLRAARAAR